jgi:hypothetical protein
VGMERCKNKNIQQHKYDRGHLAPMVRAWTARRSIQGIVIERGLRGENGGEIKATIFGQKWEITIHCTSCMGHKYDRGHLAPMVRAWTARRSIQGTQGGYSPT